MAFCGKMDDAIRLVTCKQLGDPGGVADIHLFEAMPLRSRYGCEGVEVACIGELVDGHHRVLGLIDQLAH